jgi:hypothetical protein
MVLKKNLKSQKIEAIVLDSNANKDKFPVGFSYVLDGVTYTVESNITKDTNSQMRRLKTSNNDTEEVMIETIEKDLKEESCKIICEGKSEIKIEKKDS